MALRVFILLAAVTASAVPLSHADGGPPRAQSATRPAASQETLKAMLLKYTARCALKPSQSLEATDPKTGARLVFPGSLGLAPEWLDGTCGTDCQEKVSSCLLGLTNRTGRHVELSMASAAASLADRFQPSDDDIAFPNQEGAFFGNIFSGHGYACTGHDANKAPRVQRFCAVNPESCSGLVPLRSAGRCEDVCQLACRELSDGSRRCAASNCRDPEGRVWRHPLTIYLRDKS
jgi:hypothetical protein